MSSSSSSIWILFVVLSPVALASGFCLDEQRRRRSSWSNINHYYSRKGVELIRPGNRILRESQNDYYYCGSSGVCSGNRIIHSWRLRLGSSNLGDEHEAHDISSSNHNDHHRDDHHEIDDHHHDDDETVTQPSSSLRHQRGMAAALFATYATVMAAKCALPAVMAQLTNPAIGLEFTSTKFTAQQLLARQLALSTLAISMGKVVLGPIIDHVGGIRALQMALTTLMVLVGMIATSQSFLFFSICWIGVDFIFSSCWAACINAIHQTFPKRQWGQRISMLAIAARTGNASAFAFFAWLLHVLHHVQRPWRVIFAISALLQLIPISLLTYFGRKEHMSATATVAMATATPKKHAPPSVATSLAVLRREASTPEFWCHLISRSALMVFASFLLFVPTLMHVVYGASNALAAQCGSLYALGCLLAVTMGGGYSKLSRRGKFASVVTCMGAATFASVAQLLHMMGRWTMSTNVSMACFFLWGLAFSVPFYLPPSLYALARGGQESSATIADVFDIGGFGLLALFNGYVASIAQQAAPSAWITTFQLTTACSVTSLISLSLGVLLE